MNTEAALNEQDAFGRYDDFGYAPHVGYDGQTPREYGHAVLASGNYAIVEPNGDVSAICSLEDFYEI